MCILLSGIGTKFACGPRSDSKFAHGSVEGQIQKCGARSVRVGYFVEHVSDLLMGHILALGARKCVEGLDLG